MIVLARGSARRSTPPWLVLGSNKVPTVFLPFVFSSLMFALAGSRFRCTVRLATDATSSRSGVRVRVGSRYVATDFAATPQSSPCVNAWQSLLQRGSLFLAHCNAAAVGRLFPVCGARSKFVRIRPQSIGSRRGDIAGSPLEYHRTAWNEFVLFQYSNREFMMKLCDLSVPLVVPGLLSTSGIGVHRACL